MLSINFKPNYKIIRNIMIIILNESVIYKYILMKTLLRIYLF